LIAGPVCFQAITSSQYKLVAAFLKQGFSFISIAVMLNYTECELPYQ